MSTTTGLPSSPTTTVNGHVIADQGLPNTSINAWPVTIVSGSVSANIGEVQPFYGSAVPAAIETTLLTFVTGVNGFAIYDVHCSGRDDALFKVKDNGTSIAYGQINWTERVDNIHFESGALIDAGHTITITVTSYSTMAADFFGSLHGKAL